MADIFITQAEADDLIKMEKHRLDDASWNYPCFGGTVKIPLISFNRRERFFLDINRYGRNLIKCSYQNRGREVIILVRLCMGSTHRNPDGEDIASPHLHRYREGYGDKYAIPVPEDLFPHLKDYSETLRDFIRYCHITKPPNIVEGFEYNVE
ncbi:MAG: hypothetical protein AB1656_08060 [Candidatus Omnitrophota bacterium]